MDGVLINTEPLHYRCLKEILKEKNGIDLDYEVYLPCIGSTRGFFMNLINENYGPVFDDVDKMNALMKEKKAQITEAEGFPEMPGIKEALKQLKDEGYLLAVASSSPAYAIKDALKSLDMEKYFTVVMSGDYVEHPKPAPDTFLVTAEKLGMKPEDCLVVEDSTNGGEAARAAGMKCIWFHNPDSGRQDILDAVLEFPDDRLPVTKAKEVTKAVTELIGLDRGQFTQIAMLAQGDFMKLLFSKTEERSKIFREIFHTRPYLAFQEKMKNASGRLQEQYEDVSKSILQYMKDISCEEDDVLATDVKKIRESKAVVHADKVLEVLEILTNQDADSVKEKKKNLTKIEKDLEELNQRIGKAEAVIRAKKELEKAEQTIAEKTPTLKELEMALKKEQGKVPEREQLTEEIGKRQEKLAEYDELKKLQKQIKELEKQIEILKDRESRYQEKKAQMQVQLEQKRNLLEQLKDAEIKVLKVTAEQKEVSVRKEAAEDILIQYKRYQRQKKSVEEAQKAYLVMQEECTERKTQLAWMERAFLDEQAGILAKVLKTGEPCPVCGSVQHPCPAQMTEGAPEKEELEKYRKETANVEKKTNDASFKANEKLVQLKALEEEIQKSVKSFDSSIQEEEIEKSLALIGQQMDVLEKSEKELQKKLEVAKEAVAEKQKLEAEIPELEQMQKKLQEEEQERKNQLLVSERDKANAEEQAVKVRGKLEFPEKTEAEQKIKELDKQKKEIDKNLSAAQKAFQDCSQSVEAAKTKKKTLEKQIAGNKETDMEELVQARQEVSGAKKELQKQMEEIRIRYENNLKIRNAIDKQSAKLLELERNWTQVREISDTVNGKIKGGSKEKIKYPILF